MSTEEMFEELRGEIARLREQVEALRAEGTRIVIIQPSPLPIPVVPYPVYPIAPPISPWGPSTNPYPVITW